MKFEISIKETEIIATHYEEAYLYCQFLEADGKKDWRLPTIWELDVISRMDNDFSRGWYWSSNASTYYHPPEPTLLDFGYTGQDILTYYCRAVRDI